MTIQNTHPWSDGIKETLKALSNEAAKRKKKESDLLKKRRRKEERKRAHIHPAGYENYCSIRSDNSIVSSSVYETPDNIRWVA